MLTAKEARELSFVSVDDRVKEALELIHEAAINKKRHIRLDNTKAWYWSSCSADEWDECKMKLESLGYVVTFFYDRVESNWTYISWAE